MNTGNDFETINSLKKLQDSVQSLLTISQERLQQAGQLQTDANSIQAKLDEICAVHNILEDLKKQGDIEKLFENLQNAQASIVFFKLRYDSFSKAIEETIGLLQDMKTELSVRTRSDDLFDISSVILEQSFIDDSQEQVIDHFVQSLLKLGLQVEASATVDTICSIRALRQDLLEQQNELERQLSTASHYSTEFHQAKVQMELAVQQVEASVTQNEEYSVQVNELGNAVQLNAAQVAERARTVEEDHHKFQEEFQKAQNLLLGVKNIQTEIVNHQDQFYQQKVKLESKIETFQAQIESEEFKALVGKFLQQEKANLGLEEKIEYLFNEIDSLRFENRNLRLKLTEHETKLEGHEALKKIVGNLVKTVQTLARKVQTLKQP